MIEQVAQNKSSLLLKNIVQITHKHPNYLQSILKQKVFTKAIKMPGWWAWVEGPRGL
jgi:hypothetical protein